MPYLASDVTAGVRQHLSAFYPDTDPQALVLVNEAHSTLIRECGLVPYSTLDLALVAGQGEYALNPDVYRIAAAFYLPNASPNAGWKLWESSVSELDQRYPYWRIAPASQPSRYYEEGGMLGLYPAPNQTGLGGYPKVRLSVLTRSAIPTISSPLPAQLPNLQAYEWTVCELWAIRNDDAQISKFAALAKESKRDLKTFTQTKLVRGRTTVRPKFHVPRRA